jgi:hypothetical protein
MTFQAWQPPAGNYRPAARLSLLFLPVMRRDLPEKARFGAFFAVAHPLLNLSGRKSQYEDRGND